MSNAQYSRGIGRMGFWGRSLASFLRRREEAELTARECLILTLLYERTGEAVSRDVILDVCWGVDYYPQSRTLDQHIAKLRRKVGEGGEGGEGGGVIETVRGVGYRYRGRR